MNDRNISANQEDKINSSSQIACLGLMSAYPLFFFPVCSPKHYSPLFHSSPLSHFILTKTLRGRLDLERHPESFMAHWVLEGPAPCYYQPPPFPFPSQQSAERTEISVSFTVGIPAVQKIHVWVRRGYQ